MGNDFDVDPFPGRPRILFIGYPESSHTHSWIELLDGQEFNIRLFCLPSQEPPPDWPVRCYLTAPRAVPGDSDTRRQVFPPARGSLGHFAFLAQEECARGLGPGRALGTVARALSRGLRRLDGEPGGYSYEMALAKVVKGWRPDIVHTLGIDPASYFYLRARRAHGLAGIGRWVAQARGGPDLALARYAPDLLPQILDIFRDCDHFIADNQLNYDFALGAGLGAEKIAEPGMGVVPGPGGLDVAALAARAPLPPSQRERIIVWPKAYETYTAKAMPVFAAILKVWDKIAPCRIEMLWMTQPEVRIWYEKLFPDEIKQHCPAHTRLSRDETLALMAQARVLLAPSVSDGIPNAMMEAMALGAVPLVSPLDTIVPVVAEGVNVLFADNLYPDQIAEALVRLMSDDDLVDRMSETNRRHVLVLADRHRVQARAIDFYREVARLACR